MSQCLLAAEARGLWIVVSRKSAFRQKMLFAHWFSWLNFSIFIMCMSLGLREYLRGFLSTFGSASSFKNSNNKDYIIAYLQPNNAL